MTAPRRLAILHDSPDFGGHERAFMTWLPAVLDSPRIEAIYMQVPRRNEALLAAVSNFESSKFHIDRSAYIKGAAEPLRAPFRVAFGRATAEFVAERRADLVLLLQGRIENLATPMLWLPRRLEVVSYLPMAHSGSEMGTAAAVALAADTLKRLYYRRPDRLVVPSRAVAMQARRAGVVAPIHVVENVPPPPPPRRERAAIRRALELPADGRIALFMGRFDTHQKGLDHLLRDLRRERSRLTGWCFVFVGRGRAADAVRAEFNDGGLNGRVVDWTTEPESYLAASDILLAPSRFEGVPLVLLEALQQGVPVLASDIDVYREYLPSEAIRDFTRAVDLPAALDALTTPQAIDAYRHHAENVVRRLDRATSQRAFVSALVGDAASATPA